jgi:hypothetical protein
MLYLWIANRTVPVESSVLGARTLGVTVKPAWPLLALSACHQLGLSASDFILHQNNISRLISRFALGYWLLIFSLIQAIDHWCTATAFHQLDWRSSRSNGASGVRTWAELLMIPARLEKRQYTQACFPRSWRFWVKCLWKTTQKVSNRRIPSRTHPFV